MPRDTSRSPWPRVLRGVALDFAAWYALPALFLALYVGRHFVPAAAVPAHLRVVLLPLVLLGLLRLALGEARFARPLAALAVAALLGTLIAYYALVLLGLESWGRVPSWELVASYARQVPGLADALGVSLPLAAAAAALGYGFLALGAWTYLGRFDWAGPLRRAVSAPVVACLLVAGALAGAIESYRFIAGPPTEEAEPLSLTFYPLQAAWDMQGHAVDRLAAARRDAAEDAERARYVVSPGAARRNVVLIVVDALRLDHMGLYGYRRGTTPALDRLEAAGMLRKTETMRAACGSSMCGLLSLASSRFVHQFSTRAITLQEVLRRHGYRVHMALSGDHTLFYGLRRLYGEVDSYFDARTPSERHYVNDDRIVLRHLAALPPWDGTPTMLQVHLMSAHVLGVRHASPYIPATSYWKPLGRAGERAAAVNFYDNGVRQADATIAEALRLLGDKGYLGEAVVAITADHGESLGEHGVYGHSNSVWEEALRVPFALVAYGYRPAKPFAARVLASQADIAPTILAELGIAAPSTWVGAALHEPVARELVPFQERWEIGLYDLREPGRIWKYWVDTRTGEEHAYELVADPRERVNRVAAVPREQIGEWRLQTLSAGSVMGKFRYGQDEPPQ